MEQDELIRAIVTFLIVGIIIPMTLWYLGIRKNSSQFKMWAVVVAVIYFVAVGIDLGTRWFGLFEESTFRTGLVGPARRAEESSITRETPYYVKHADRRHLIELLPVAKIGEQAVGSLTLRYEVRAPDDEMLAQGQETVRPAKGDKWAAIHTEFPARDVGLHKLVVEVPKPAGEIKVTISEVKR
jgi:hypothetical protein